MHFRLFYIVSILISLEGLAQKPSIRSEKDAIVLFEKIEHWISYPVLNDSVNTYDSLTLVNRKFITAFTDYLNKNPSTLTFGFKKLIEAGLIVASSQDQKLRIYSWDTWTGGTMHIFSSIIQYKTSSGVRAKILLNGCEEEFSGDPGCWYDTIYVMKTPAKTYYLASEHSIYSSGDRYWGFSAFSISGNVLLENIKLFKQDDGLTEQITENLGFEFRDIEDGVRLKFDTINKIITVPEVNNEGDIISRTKYKFNGKYFVAIN